MSTPFGSFVLHGRSETSNSSMPAVRQDIERIDEQFANAVYWCCWAGAAAILLFHVVSEGRRRRVKEEYLAVVRGDLTPADDYATEAELKTELERRKNPNALYFIAPGNVYRLLAIMHPGVVGWHGYRQLAF